MHKLLNGLLVMTVLGSAYVLYNHEHAVRTAERDVTKLKTEISDAREEIKILNAEWASLTRVDRLERLSSRFLNLQPVDSGQLVDLDKLNQHLQPDTSGAQNSDQIGDIITGSTKRASGGEHGK